MAFTPIICGVLFFVTWLVICEASVHCYYTKEPVGECDYATKKQRIKHNLRTNDSNCEPTRVVLEDCQPGSPPSQNPTATENVANVREMVKGEEALLLVTGHEDFIGQGRTQCLRSRANGRSLYKFYQRLNYFEYREKQKGDYIFDYRGYSASYTFDNTTGSGTLHVTPHEPVRPSLPFSGSYDIVYSTRNCFVLRKRPISGSSPSCGVWVRKSKALNSYQECLSAFQGSCRSAGESHIYAPYFKALCSKAWGLEAQND
uniref:Putative secreted protein n=1 Tax=Amblyomma triste TaxID=251400 RepID=A0A023G3A0_AMBTT